MMSVRSLPLMALVFLTLVGCASVPPLSDSAGRVREISRDDSKGCTFLKLVTFTDTLVGPGKSYGLVHQAGENGLRNAIAVAGGDAFVAVQKDADWFWGNINYSGEAYQCARS